MGRFCEEKYMWRDIAKFGKKLTDSGLVGSQFGNISLRNGDKMLITKTGVSLDEIKKNSVVELDIGKPSNLDPIASSETLVHRTIYKNTPALSIIHAHLFFRLLSQCLLKTKPLSR